MTDEIVGYNGGIYPSEHKHHQLTFQRTPAVGRLFGTHLKLHFSQNYSIQQSSVIDGEWKVRTEGYIYRVDDEEDNEIFSYHWHPFGNLPRQPHFHTKRKGSGVTRFELEKGHIPTGRISIESIVLFLVEDFGVQPRGEDWERTVKRNLAAFEQYRSWA